MEEEGSSHRCSLISRLINVINGTNGRICRRVEILRVFRNPREIYSDGFFVVSKEKIIKSREIKVVCRDICRILNERMEHLYVVRAEPVEEGETKNGKRIYIIRLDLIPKLLKDYIDGDVPAYLLTSVWVAVSHSNGRSVSDYKVEEIEKIGKEGIRRVILGDPYKFVEYMHQLTILFEERCLGNPYMFEKEQRDANNIKEIFGKTAVDYIIKRLSRENRNYHQNIKNNIAILILEENFQEIARIAASNLVKEYIQKMAEEYAVIKYFLTKICGLSPDESERIIKKVYRDMFEKEIERIISYKDIEKICLNIRSQYS